MGSSDIVHPSAGETESRTVAARQTSSDILTVSDLTLSFGGLAVLKGVGLQVSAGTIHGLLGPNGAGKTSLFNCVCGLYQPQEGAIAFRGTGLNVAPYKLASLGIARTFQHPTLDPHLSVIDNVMAGRTSRMRGGFLSSGFGSRSVRADERRARAESEKWLESLELTGVAHRSPSSLPYASQKLVELGRAMVNEPQLLLLDEPAGGLAHSEIDELGERIQQLRAENNLTILLVEHHMGFVSKITDHVDVLVEGKNVMSGTAAEAQNDPRVVEAYLGRPA